MVDHFDFDVILRSLGPLLRDGLTFTLKLTALATVGGTVFGTVLAVLRLRGPGVIGRVAALYVNGMRSLPLVLVIFWFFFLAPYVGQWILHAERPIPVGVFASSILTFTLFEAAYFSEIVRAGIQSIPRGQAAAAEAVGLSPTQVMRYVVLPQAFRNMLPIMLTQAIVLFQDTSLVYVISAPDLLGVASQVAHRDGRLVEMYLFVAAVYFVISLVASSVVRQLQARTALVRPGSPT